MSSRKLLIAVLAGAVSVAGLSWAWASSHDVPLPPGVDPDGTVTVPNMPERIPVADENGNLAGYVDRNAMFGPPTGLPTEVPEPQKLPVTDQQGKLVGFLGENGFQPIVNS